VKLDWTGALWTAALPALGCAMIAGTLPSAALAGGSRRVDAHERDPDADLRRGLALFGSGLPGLAYGKHIEVIPVGWRE